MKYADNDETQKEREQLVADWLLATPGFFERHASLLAQIQLKDANSDKVVSLQEKQMAILRNQNRDLNHRLSEMFRFGTENDRTQNLMVNWLGRLLKTPDLESTIQEITDGLNQLFEVGEVKYINITDITSEELIQLKLNVVQGECAKASLNLNGAIDPSGGSFATVLLRESDKCFGALCFISADSQKYSLASGATYLEQIGKLATAAISRFNG